MNIRHEGIVAAVGNNPFRYERNKYITILYKFTYI